MGIRPKRPFLLLAVSLLLPIFWGAGFARAPDTIWTKTYGGVDSDVGESVEPTRDGGFVIAGYTGSFGGGDYDVYLIKTDADGDALWARTYGGANDDRAYSAHQTLDDGYIIAGYTSSFGGGDYDVYLVKTDANGDTLWTRTYGGIGDDRAYSVQQTLDDGYIVTGYTNSSGAGGYDICLIKTNASGDTVWTQTHGGAADDFGESVREAPDGGYIVAGYTKSFGAGSWDVYLLKTDTEGSPIWTKTLGGTGFDVGLSLRETSFGGYIVVGYTYSFGAGQNDVYLIRTAGNGATVWTKTYGGLWWDVGISVQRTSDAGYIIAGYTYSFGQGLGDVYLIRTAGNGDTLWTGTYGGADYDRGNAVLQTSDGGYLIAGYTHSYGAGDSDVYLIKTASGVSVEEDGPYDVSISPFSCKPNPFTDRTVIQYELPERSDVRIVIYNLLGQEVKTLVSQQQALGVQTVTWDGTDTHGSKLPSGPYFLRFSAISASTGIGQQKPHRTATTRLFMIR
jgi:hypothetical protein